MNDLISIIIPNYNGARTIGKSLESIFACNDTAREVIVVDDCSEDGSLDIIKKYPCRLIRLKRHAGASAARNAGAAASTGNVLFFIDADCLLNERTLPTIRKNIGRYGPDTIIGGTYSPRPHDPGFFSLFQSVFINYSETKNSVTPDYLATHALAINAGTFKKRGGFMENFLPILEDVEFSHRLKLAGHKLIMDPDLQVRHIFNFSLLKSLGNAARKTEYWIIYSFANKDLLADSGTASSELKITGTSWVITVLYMLISFMLGQPAFLMPLAFLMAVSLVVNSRLFKAFYKTGGPVFAFQAGLYYIMVYPAAVWTGALRGIVRFFVTSKAGVWRSDLPQK